MGFMDFLRPDKVNKKAERRAEERSKQAEEEERLRLIEETKKMYRRDSNLIERDVSAGASVAMGTDKDAVDRGRGRLSQEQDQYIGEKGDVKPGAKTWIDGTKVAQADKIMADWEAAGSEGDAPITPHELLYGRTGLWQHTGGLVNEYGMAVTPGDEDFEAALTPVTTQPRNSGDGITEEGNELLNDFILDELLGNIRF